MGGTDITNIKHQQNNAWKSIRIATKMKSSRHTHMPCTILIEQKRKNVKKCFDKMT